MSHVSVFVGMGTGPLIPCSYVWSLCSSYHIVEASYMTGDIGARPMVWQASRSFKSTPVKSMSPAYDSQAGIYQLDGSLKPLIVALLGCVSVLSRGRKPSVPAMLEWPVPSILQGTVVK
jgi:hypothetical protein